MKPRSISASSINNFEECPAKFKAANLDRVPEVGPKTPAMVGTACHYALEHFIQLTCVRKEEKWSFILLKQLYAEGYRETFGNADETTAAFDDGLTMLRSWYKRTEEYLGGVEVLSTEQKVQIPVRSSRTKESCLLTFIFDLAVLIKDGDRTIVKVCDFKTQREYVPPDKLKTQHRQARIYALAAAVHFKDLKPDEIVVELDLLRYVPVSTSFTREDNIATRDYVRETLQIILDTDEVKPPRRLSSGCRYCPIRMTCGEWRKNKNHGGDMSLESLEDAVRLRDELDSVKKLIEGNLSTVDDFIVGYAKENNEVEFEVPGFEVKVTASSQRVVNTELAAKVIGPELMAQVGSLKIGDVERLVKGELLSEAQKSALSSAVTKKWGSLGVKIKRTALGG